MLTKYAQNYNQVVDYFRENYLGFDGFFDADNTGFDDSHIFKLRSAECKCGESSAISILDEQQNEIERIIICDSCYETALNRV